MRIKNLPNDEIPKRFVGNQEGYNKEGRFSSQLNAGRWTAYSYEMPIAIWHDNKVFMPLVDSSFNLDSSVKTKQHIREIYWAVKRSEIEIVEFIPQMGDWYTASSPSWNCSGRDETDLQHLVYPKKEGGHYSKQSWKTETGALKNAISWIDSYRRFPNFKNMDVKLVYGRWHVCLEYLPLVELL